MFSSLADGATCKVIAHVILPIQSVILECGLRAQVGKIWNIKT